MNIDKEGRLLKFDVRKDEEQFQKFEEIIEILCAAGYFRARIKGWKDFDKIVGGMTWCIKMSNTDIDIDLMFEENLSIGQKISLTEKIVQVLKKMKCPYALEPHQIQGMDSVHIFPVIQWLVKKSIEYRQKNEAIIKSYAVNMFNKDYTLPINKEEQILKDRKKHEIITNDPDREPIRNYRHSKKSTVTDEAINTQITILEYKGSFIEKSDNKFCETDDISYNHSQHQSLMNAMNEETHLKVSASIVGSVVKEKSEEIKQLAKEFVRTQKAMKENSLEFKKYDLNVKLKKMKKEIEDNKKKCDTNNETYSSLKFEIAKVIEKQMKLEPNNDIENEKEKDEKKKLYLEVDRLKKEKKSLIQKCKLEEKRLEKEIENLESQDFESDDEKELKIELNKEKKKMNKLKPQLIDTNKQVAILQRKLDDIPSRDELNQYQKRFLELYNQIAGKQNETKKFYMLYNQLDDTLIHLNKELMLMDSILNNFNQAMVSSQSSKDQFLSQFEQIVENIKSAKLTLEKKEQMEKVKKDQLNDSYLASIDKRRLYYKAVKEFKEEIRLNEILNNKLNKV